MKFLVCYDETKEAKKALKVAQEHAKIWQAKLEVVNTTTGILLRDSEPLISLRMVRPSIPGMFKSSSIKAGREISANSPRPSNISIDV